MGWGGGEMKGGVGWGGGEGTLAYTLERQKGWNCLAEHIPSNCLRTRQAWIHLFLTQDTLVQPANKREMGEAEGVERDGRGRGGG